MTQRQLAELLLLGAIWGASFLFMRTASPEFGPLALAFVRVAGAAALLLPVLALRRGSLLALRLHWRAIAVVGVLNSALPFVLFMVAALALQAGLMAVFNAAAPLWAAVVAWLWLGERPSGARVLGLLLGLAGVALLVASRGSTLATAGRVAPLLAVAACIVATVLYGISAVYARRRLQAVPAMAVAAGSQTAAALVLLPAALWAWPRVPPGAGAWADAALLAFACTGLAYLLYFRLIAQAGAQQAITVTLLVPVFAIAWGWALLAERPDAPTLGAAALVLLGTALAVGLLRLPRRAAEQP